MNLETETSQAMEIARLREALQFYNWKHEDENAGDWNNRMLEGDMGDKANEALSAPAPDPSNVLRLAAWAYNIDDYLTNDNDWGHSVLRDAAWSKNNKVREALPEETRAFLEGISTEGCAG